METKAWAAIHRKHHAKCETTDDPHSPQIMGLPKVLWEGAELYRIEGRNKETLERYGQGTPDDWIERNLYTPHSAKGILIMLAIDLILFGIPGLTVWAIQMAWIPFFAAGVINGIGHYWGYRNFECPDAARNIFPWGILIGGEELHNNHHTFGTAAKLSVKWWEFDLGWFYIRLFSMLGLAKVKKLPPQLQNIRNKTTIDAETLKALLVGRFQVMAQYSKEVILPVLREEQRKATNASRDLLLRGKSLLVRADTLLDDKGKQLLGHILENRQSLQHVYQFRLKLQEIWSRTTASQKELMEALQDWCQQAEATGIATLKNFASKLRGYALATVKA
jgi:stearoyl-CoA desaturase (delta-9 desaturase)